MQSRKGNQTRSLCHPKLKKGIARTLSNSENNNFTKKRLYTVHKALFFARFERRLIGCLTSRDEQNYFNLKKKFSI